MNKVWIGAAVAVLAAGIGLYMLLDRDGGESTAKTKAPAVDNNPVEPPDPGTPTPVEPELADRPDVTSTSRTEGYTEYINDAGVRIRDKRGRAVATDYEAPVKRPFKALDIDARVMDHMGRELRNLARECKSEHGSEIGEGARVQPRVTFEIVEGQLNVTEADISLTGVPSDGAFQRCFHSGAIGLAVAADGHREVKEHKMLVPIDLESI